MNWDYKYLETPTATHFEVFEFVGKHYAENIRNYLKENSFLEKFILPFVHSRIGCEVLHNLIEFNKKVFPDFYSELMGYAAGSQIDQEMILILNFQTELLDVMEDVYGSRKTFLELANCSDFFLNTENSRLLAHNEDIGIAATKYSYFVKYNFNDGTSFTAFTYPGQLPGNAFGWTSTGMAVTANAQFPKFVKKSHNGIGRVFLNRCYLSAKTLSEAIAMTAQYQPDLVDGFSINLGQIGSKSMYAIEIGPSNDPKDYAFHVKEISNGFLLHVNTYANLNIEQKIDESSMHRIKRVREIELAKQESSDKKEFDKNDLIDMMGDEEDQIHPIHRTGKKSDFECVTAAVAIYDLLAKKVEIFTSNPKTSNPIAVFDL